MVTELDLSSVYNPYNFAHPVDSKDLFSGRERELDEIHYYLDEAKLAPKPISLAILGERAAGKTSLLNMIDREATERGLCVARIDLNEADVTSPLAFFFKLCDSIFGAACRFEKSSGSGESLYAFGGLKGQTYDIYRDMVSCYDIPGDKTFCPFLFPLDYAKAMSKGITDCRISDSNIKMDLAVIRREVGMCIVVIFDECNVLINNRVLLEMLRNIFMNISGYMLVFAGTMDLFPLMDDVFSPIIRQFKKIQVRFFEKIKETKECIRKPLEKLGIKPESVFDFRAYGKVRDIHTLSAGRPYEIQLICHMIFRRVQQKRSQNMTLDLSVLEDVRKELANSQDISVRSILNEVRQLRKSTLAAIGALCKCEGRATLGQIWDIEYILHGEERFTEDDLRSECDRLVEKKILTLREDKIAFLGDEFDRVYMKYFAREQGVVADVLRVGPEEYVAWSLGGQLETETVDTIVVGLGDEDAADVEDVVNNMEKGGDKHDVFAAGDPLVERLYRIMVMNRNEERLSFIKLRLSLAWSRQWHLFFVEPGEAAESIQAFKASVKVLSDRVRQRNGDLAIDIIEIGIVSWERLVQEVEETANTAVRAKLSRFHCGRMAKAYIEKRDVEAARFHLAIALRYEHEPPLEESNNIGYMFLALEQLDEAEKLLRRSIDGRADPREKALPTFNYGVLLGKRGEYRKALDYVERAINLLDSEEGENIRCGCLLLPNYKDGVLSYHEVFDVNLLTIASEAKTQLQQASEAHRG